MQGSRPPASRSASTFWLNRFASDYRRPRRGGDPRLVSRAAASLTGRKRKPSKTAVASNWFVVASAAASRVVQAHAIAHSLAAHPRCDTVASVPLGQPEGDLRREDLRHGNHQLRETLRPTVQIEEVPDGFRKLDWNDFFAVDDEFLEALVGNTNAIRTGEAAGLIMRTVDRPASNLLIGTMISISTAATSPRSTQTILGSRCSGSMMARGLPRRFLSSTRTQEFVRFGAQFDDIDEVRFTAKGGTDPDPNDASRSPPGFCGGRPLHRFLRGCGGAAVRPTSGCGKLLVCWWNSSTSS